MTRGGGRSAMGEVQWLSVWKWAANLWNCGLEFADKCERHRAVSVGIPRIAYMSLCFVRFLFHSRQQNWSTTRDAGR